MLKTNRKDLIKLFRKLGVKKGDTVLIHTSTLSLGKLEGGLNTLHQSLLSLLSNQGNIIVPTFTYSFRRKKIFNINKSNCCKSMGIYPEYFRNLKDAVRSADPLFSMCCIGPDANELMRRESNCSFGKNSVFEKIVKKNALIIGLGITYTIGFPIFMYLEKKGKVDYRIDKKFFGYSINKKKRKFKDSIIHFARNEKKFPELIINREKVGKMLEKKKICKNLKFKYGRAISFRTLSFEKENLKLLKKNPNVFVEKK